jgi:hypothetical protein
MDSAIRAVTPDHLLAWGLAGFSPGAEQEGRISCFQGIFLVGRTGSAESSTNIQISNRFINLHDNDFRYPEWRVEGDKGL